MAHKRDPYERIRGDSAQQRRILMTALLLGVAAFLPIIVQLYRLMVIDHNYYADLALRNQSRTTNVTVDRGEILDRNMNVLATSQMVETVYLDPQELKQSKADITQVSQTLAQILDLDPQWIAEQAQDRRQRYKRIAAKIDRQDGDQIRDFINSQDIRGIHLEPESKRY